MLIFIKLIFTYSITTLSKKDEHETEEIHIICWYISFFKDNLMFYRE